MRFGSVHNDIRATPFDTALSCPPRKGLTQQDDSRARVRPCVFRFIRWSVWRKEYGKSEGRGTYQTSMVRQGPISLREASTSLAANTPEIPDISNSADVLTLAKINYTSIVQVRLLIIDVRSLLLRKWVTLTSLCPKERHFGLISLVLRTIVTKNVIERVIKYISNVLYICKFMFNTFSIMFSMFNSKLILKWYYKCVKSIYSDEK